MFRPKTLASAEVLPDQVHNNAAGNCADIMKPPAGWTDNKNRGSAAREQHNMNGFRTGTSAETNGCSCTI